MEPFKWDVLIRVLEDPRTDLAAFASTADDSASDYSAAPSSVAAAGPGGDMSFVRGTVAYASAGRRSAGTAISSAADRSATEIYEAHHYREEQEVEEHQVRRRKTWKIFFFTLL